MKNLLISEKKAFVLNIDVFMLAESNYNFIF